MFNWILKWLNKGQQPVTLPKFDWETHYNWLITEKPDSNLQGIADAKFEVLKIKNPLQASWYEELSSELAKRINSAWDLNPDFGYDESCQITQDFIKEKGLQHLFIGEVPRLSPQISN